ncbi:hypothetical protein IWW38_005139, partial [Coemansia aciculifera]
MSSTTSDKGEDSNGAWRARKRDGVAKYHSALEAAYTALYPQCICHPLHSSIYPVLNSLLQIYSDGPRHVLGEIAALSNSSNLSVFPTSEQDGERLARLQGALSNDLPKLFEHERAVVRLLLEQIVAFKRNFYRQMHDSLAICAEDALSRSSDFLSTASCASDSQKERDSLASGNIGIRSAYDRRANERIVSNSDAATWPSANECISNIQSNLWLLMQDTDINGLALPTVKPRRRRSTTGPAESPGRISGHLLAAGGHLVASAFESVAPKFGSPWYASASTEPVPALPDSRNADEMQQFGTGMWHHVESPIAASQDAMPRPPMSKHSRKKSTG